MAITEADLKNFDTLTKAFENGDVALMECRCAETGEYRAVICTVMDIGGEVAFAPFAALPHKNPYEMFIPPMDEGEDA